MTIEDKSLQDITSEDIENLNGKKEGARLEFKQTIPDSWKLLREICAMANADGGLLIIGAKEKNEICIGFENIKDVEINAQRIRQSILDSIEERIVGFGIKPLNLKSGENILVVFIPSSFNKPHMIKKDKKTEFWKRYETDKRPMTLAEIKYDFTNYSSASQFKLINDKISHIQNVVAEKQEIENERKAASTTSQIYKLRRIEVFLDTIDKGFTSKISTKRILRLTITPHPLSGELFDPSDKSILDLLVNPPDHRHAGWNMENTGNFKLNINGFYLDNNLFRDFRLYRNGHLEFFTEIDENFSWKQDEIEHKSHPLLYPLPVTEYPVSFLTFAKALFKHLNYKGRYLWRMNYYNIQGCILRPLHPSAHRFSFQSKLFENNNYNFQDDLENDFHPDTNALKLIAELYYSVGYSRNDIPFFDENDNFVIPNE